MALHPFDIPLIKDQVTQYLGSHDLLCLVQVSRLWSDWFLPSLWHSFRIHYRFRELTDLTTPVKTITVRTKRDRAVVVPYYYHHYCHTYGTDEDEDEDDDDQDDQDGQLSQKGVPSSSSSRRSAADAVVYTPLTLYKRYVHSLVLYKAIPVIFQEPCPYRFENLQQLQLYNWVQTEEAPGIPPFLRAHPRVQELTLGYMIRDPEQMRALAEVLLGSSMMGLKRLSLTLTQLEGRRSARRLVQALSRLQEARFVVHDFYEQKEEEKEDGKEDEEMQGPMSSSSSSSSSITNLRRLFISVPKALDTTVIFPFLRRCRHLERLEIRLRQSSQEEFGALCNGALFPRLEQLRLHTDAASDDVVTSILADENHREPPEGGTGPWRRGGGVGGGLRLEVLKITTTKREHIYPGSFWALAQFHGQTLTSLELEGLERMALLDYNVMLGRLVKLLHLKITISLWPPKQQPETSYGSGALTTTTRRRMLNGRGQYDSEPWKWLGPTWGCVHLQTLHLTLRHVPSDGRPPSPPGEFEHVTAQCMEESYLNIIGQIGKLKELRELVLQGPLNPLRLKAVDPSVRNEEDTICRRLSMLSGLCELRALDIEQLRGKLIGIEEVVWMLDHWPRLVQLKGLENLSTKDVVAWLHARRPWMDIGRK